MPPFSSECSTKLVARQSPDWLQQSVIYQIFLRVFTNEGTLEAARQHLPRLADLGVDIIYLCPICLQDDDPRLEYWSDRQQIFGNAQNPYRIKDFFAIDPEYGDASDLARFVNDAHALGLRVLMDLVYPHCGPAAVFLKEHPDFVKRTAQGEMEFTPYHFPSINFENPGLCEYLWKNMEYWISEFGIDGYRCDYSDKVPLRFWEEARSRLAVIKPEIILLAEGHRKEAPLSAFDINYAFPWAFGVHSIFNRGNPASSLRQIWESMCGEFPAGTRFIRYIDNHDIANDTSQGMMRNTGWGRSHDDASWQAWTASVGIPPSGLPGNSRIDKSWGIAGANAAIVLSFTLDGIPFLYNGQEVADTGLHCLFIRQSTIDWNATVSSEAQERQALIRRLCAIRHSETALTQGTMTWVDNACPDQLITFLRQVGDTEIFVGINLSNRSAHCSAPVTPRVLLSHNIKQSGSSMALEPYGYFVGAAS